MTAYISRCPRCNAEIDIPEVSGWSPIDQEKYYEDEDDDSDDGGWSRNATCSCGKVYLVHWKGKLPYVEKEIFYREINIAKGRVEIVRTRFLLGFPPNSLDAPTGIGKRELQRMKRNNDSQEKMKDKLLNTCAMQVGLTMTEAERKNEPYIEPGG